VLPTSVHMTCSSHFMLYVLGSSVASQKQTLQGMAGRFNFPPTIPFPLLFMLLMKLGNFLNYIEINSWFSQFIKKTQNVTYSTFIVQCGFL